MQAYTPGRRMFPASLLLVAVCSLLLNSRPAYAEKPWNLHGKFEAPLGLVRAIAFAPDDNMLAVGCGESEWIEHPVRGAVMLIDVAARRVVRIIRTRSFGAPDSIAFSADGRRVIACWWGGYVTSWDCGTGESRKEWHDSESNRACLAPQASLLAWTGRSGKLCVWDLAAKKQVAAWSVPVSAIPWALQFSPDSALLATASERDISDGNWRDREDGGDVKLYDVRRAALVAKLDAGSGRQYESLAFSSDGKMLAAKRDNGIIAFWDVPTRKLLRRPYLGGSIVGMALSRGGKRLVTTTMLSHTVQVFDVGSGRRIAAFSLSEEQRPSDSNMPTAFSHDEKTLAVASDRGIIGFWDVPD